ncbi:Fc receptor-like protein 6 isoform X2 [Chiloscyllium plagiosum]|uniref:Fc receptor-like protein 6 isoform X2 n=1 Tax=Chiloscyllium plagiosum TaxID=36176 RepID=UPI001CB82FCE|nr:Fc receptor-like protein 6 isoform X2 [Chiloscyllium plagiosum]
MTLTSVLLILLILALCRITQAFGRPVLNVYPTNGFVKEGETLKFQCGTGKVRAVIWYKNGQFFAYGWGNYYETLANNETGGSYHCEIYNSWKKSETVKVVVTDRNVAFHVVPVSPLEGETLKLNCRYKYDHRWKKDFGFYRNGKKIHSMWLPGRESSYSIKVNSTDDSGWYSCKIDWSESRNVKVQVQERFAQPVLRVEPASEVFEGLPVTLTCTVPVAQPFVLLHYSFYRDSVALEAVPGLGSIYTINAAAVNISGNYTCEAINTVYSLRKRSSSIQISIKQVYTVPVLTVRPEEQLFDGQRVKLVCWVEANPSQVSLQYSFYRNGIVLQSPSHHSDYISESARPTDSGIYHCEVTDGKVWKCSNQLDLSIMRIPVSKPELIIQPGKDLIKGDTGCLICSVSNGSLPIYYQFYNSSSVELYSELSNSTELVYNIGPISRRDEGFYHCSVRNEVTGPQHSEDIEITVIARSYSKEIMASLLPVLLMAGLLVSGCYIYRRATGNSSTASQPRITGSQPSGEGTAASNLEYAVVGAAHNAENITADLVYSEVTIKKRKEPGNSIAFCSDVKKDSKTDLDDYCITYATLNLSEPSQEEDGGDGNVYMNIPRK